MSPHSKRKPSRRLSIDPTENLSPDMLINRELSWLEFNDRVLSEAWAEHNPLLERVKFLAIYALNLDEFFMIRVSGLRRLAATGAVEVSPDGMLPAEQLDSIRRHLAKQLVKMEECWHKELLPKLKDAGISILRYWDLDSREQEAMRQFFEWEIYPVLTPLAFDPAHPFPHISNLSLNLAVLLKDEHKNERFARIKVPDLFPRLITVPDPAEGDNSDIALTPSRSIRLVWLEDIIAANLDRLFKGMRVVSAYPFRVTRDADFEIEEDEASDLLESVEESVEMRQFGSGVRLEVDKTMPPRVKQLLSTNLGIPSFLVYTQESPIGMADLRQLWNMDFPSLKDGPFIPALPPPLAAGAVVKSSIFDVIKKQDVLLYHPYDSFIPVVDFIREAAQDSKVLAIKQTLYRVGPNSPIVDALLEARENGKQVAVLVELKARFDEENNIAWARKLEQEGVHVAYGLLGLKTHAKICLVVRREAGGTVRYVHLSTGNYNPSTARVYGDLSLFTADPDFGADASDMFNSLTGYSRQESYRKLLVGPGTLRQEIINRINREIDLHRKDGSGYIAMKMNSLVDPECIKALYRASIEGVKIDLQIRGICGLRPGIKGLSENIQVTSIVGRFLEHSRIYYFRNGGAEEIFLGSADLMPRNLDRRVELLFPICNDKLRRLVIDNILKLHLADNQRSWQLLPNGTYRRLEVPTDTPSFNSQDWLLANWSR